MRNNPNAPANRGIRRPIAIGIPVLRSGKVPKGPNAEVYYQIKIKCRLKPTLASASSYSFSSLFWDIHSI